ncbi:porin [Aggregatibacter kilianii]|uniref:porin n=1 Tax=Aggregatibacter kilianii TaxID=2025884 RepID=UPI000D65EE98|nr:porin [Aggregatibacter kilianii]
MKKTLLALALTAMAATSANAAVIYQTDGTKVDLDGRGALEIVKAKGKRTDLVDRGSRVRVRAYQDIGGGFTALGAVEIRFTTNGTVGDGVKTQRLFVGMSHEDIGSLTFGRQLTLGDHIPKANYSYELGGNVLHDSAPKAAHFMSSKFAGFRFAADYYFGEADKTKAASGQGYGVGAFYDGQWDDLAVRFGSGYVEITKGNTKADDYKQKMLGVGFDVKYKIVSVGLDWAHGKSIKGHKDYNFKHSMSAKYEKIDRFDLGFKVQATEKNAVYGAYLWGTGKNADQPKGKYRGWTLGVDHKFNKYVSVYLEGGKAQVKENGKKVAEGARVGLGTRITF